MSTTALTRPAQSQVKIEPTAKSPLSDGFNYPEIRLLNKQARTTISKDYGTTSETNYHLLAIANTRGWFAAARFNGSSYEIVLSTLSDLRDALKDAKEGIDNELKPKRTVPLPQGKPNIIAFANQDSSLIIALEQGSVLAFDSPTLFSTGEGPIQPTNSVQLQESPLRQILPNPGTEPNLVDKIAIVGTGTAQVFNIKLEPQGGWAASDPSTNPMAVAWSPKGKHIAIGLQSGDILTYSLTQMSAVHKHIPPTFEGTLISLSWTGPGHTFRTSYANPQNPSDPGLHLVSLDTKSSAGVYYSLNHPFPTGDRVFQSPYSLQFPQWDGDPSSADHSKSLILYGDAVAVELEVLAHKSQSWYQQSQENPVSLPLNKDMDDTMILSLDADLTDATLSTPIVYAYLNDGTVQGWYLQHSKPYPLMVTGNAAAPQAIQSDTPMATEDVSPTKPTVSPLGSVATPTDSGTFGQPSFGSSDFSQPAVKPTTGQPSALGNAGGGFASFAASSSPFGAQAATSPSTSPFGTSGASAYGNASSNPSPFSAFGTTNTTSVFGQGSFGVGTNNATAPSAQSAFGGSYNETSSEMTREASMADDTPGFGGLSLGTSNADTEASKTSSGGIFGSFETSTTAVTSSGFGSSGSILKPATGFGAFAPSADSPFSKPTSSTNPTPLAFSAVSSPAVSAFGKPTSEAPAFGQGGFGQSGFGQSGFGQSGFGQSGLNKPAFGQTGFRSVVPASAGFSAFANKPISLTNAAPKAESSQSPFGSATTSGGFSAFASQPASFTSTTSKQENDTAKESTGATLHVAKESSATTTSPFNANSSVFGGTSAVSPFGTPASSVFGNKTEITTNATKPDLDSSASTVQSLPSIQGNQPAKISPVGLSSPPSSPEPVSTPKPAGLNADESPPPRPTFTSSQPPVTTGAFGNLQASPSVFRPATGFGAFGNITPASSPFFKKDDNKPPPVSAFALSGTPTKNAFSPGPAGNTSMTPTFGSTSLLGSTAHKSVFSPATSPSPSPGVSSNASLTAFSAFSGTPSPFSAFSANPKPFTNVLTSGSEESKETSKEVKTESATKEDVREAKAEDTKKTSLAAKDESSSEKVSSSKPLCGEQDHETKATTEGEPNKESKEPSLSPPRQGTAKNTSDDDETSQPTKPSPSEGPGPDASFSEISSAGSSYVDIKAESEESIKGKVEAEDDDRSDDYESDEEGSDYVPSSEGEPDEDESEGVPEGELSPPGSPTSATPQPEVPGIKVTPLPDNLASKERAASTTPPGTPENEGPVIPRRSPSPSPLSTTGSPSQFGFGLGRPSTRPTRSSPLASAPLSSDDGEEETDDTARPTPLFGPKSDNLKTQDEPGKRPKTPPLLSGFGSSKPASMPATPFLAPATPPARPASTPETSSENAVPPISAFGQAPKLSPTAPSSFFNPPAQPSSERKASVFGALATPSSNKEPTPFNLPSFSLKPSQSTPPAPAAGFFNIPPPKPSFFDVKPAASAAIFPPSGQAPSLFGGLPFKATPQTPATPAVSTVVSPPSSPTPSLFGNVSFKAAPQTTPATPFPPVRPAATTPITPQLVKQRVPPPPELTMEEGMQKECALLIMSIDQQLNELRNRAQEVTKKHEELNRSVGGPWQKADLGDVQKWGLGDLQQFGQVMLKFVEDLEVLEQQRENIRQTARELTSSMLKAGTRREEIARFTKAQKDADFAKMLRTRNLGPEHSEAQTQLRRTIRSVRDRITKLESHLQASKKKLAQSNSGKVSIKAPTLDIVNRTFRNIELAITQQAGDVSDLVNRVAKLDLQEKPGPPMTPVRDARLPDPIRRKPYNVTPNVAVVTAAALNAERAAHRLKKALLSARKEPLLNVKVNTATPPPVVFSTPGRDSSPKSASDAGPSSAIPFNLAGAVFTPPPPSTPPSNWTLPADDFSPGSPSLPTTRRGATGGKKHSSVQLKRTPGSTSPAPAPAFDWGPLPSFNNAPLTSLAASFTKADLSKKA